jgi:hypothetical protein
VLLRTLAPCLLLLTLGCKDEVCPDGQARDNDGVCVQIAEGDTDTDTDSDSDADGCGTEAPTLTALTVSDGGLYDFSGDEYPSVLLEYSMEDNDGDLHEFTAHVWWDIEIDGQVATVGNPDTVLQGTAGDGPCLVDSLNVNSHLPVTSSDTSVDPGVHTEFAMIGFDAEGNETGVLIGDLVTPVEGGGGE